jgi:hypothetical protein
MERRRSPNLRTNSLSVPLAALPAQVHRVYSQPGFFAVYNPVKT